MQTYALTLTLKHTHTLSLSICLAYMRTDPRQAHLRY